MLIEKNNNVIPDYLDAKFITKSVKNGLNLQEVNIKSLNYTMGSSGGENYLSYIYRVTVVYTHKDSNPKEINLIVKSIPMDGVREIFAEMNIFNKEVEMYLGFIPRIEDCLGGVRVSPRCYHYESEPIATIVFEDMKSLGYDVSDRVKGLNEDHCKIILTKLAQYHAGGLILLDKEPSTKDSELLKEGLFSSEAFSRELLRQAFCEYYTKLMDMVSKWKGFEKVAAKLERLGSMGCIQKIVDACQIASDDIVVIIHGDMWVNNFLFKYENENKELPVDVALIDFQGSMIASIGLDINYFLYTSLQIDVFSNKRKELIESSYYPALKEALEKASCKTIPSLNDVHREIRKKAIYGFLSTIMILPTISMSKKDSADNSIEKFLDEESAAQMKDLAYTSVRFLDTLRNSLKEFDEMGVFD